MSATTAYLFTCDCVHAEGPTFGTYQDAVDYLTPLVEDEEYRLQVYIEEVDPTPSTNVTSLNAGDLFRALSILADTLPVRPPRTRNLGEANADAIDWLRRRRRWTARCWAV